MADKLYTPNEWTDEVLASDALYNILQSDDTPIHEEVKIELDTEVGTAGTAVNAERMNNIEDGIDALDDLLVEMQSKIKLDAATELTISGGSITITQSIHKLQPQSGTEDDLDTIAGIAAGDLVILYCSDPGTDTITIKHGTGNISCIGEADLELSEGGVLLYSDGTTVYAIGGGGGGGVSVYGVCDGRMTLTTGVPYTASDVEGVTDIYFTPYHGNQIGLYDGAEWQVVTFTEKTLDISAATASKPYDLFGYLDSGTLALESLVWTDGSTRATALTTQDGVLVKSGDPTRRYLGSFYVNGDGETNDADHSRLIQNYYHKRKKNIKTVQATAHSYTTATTRAWNANTTVGEARLEVMVGVIEETIFAIIGARIVTAANSSAVVSIGLNATGAMSLTAPIRLVAVVDAGETWEAAQSDELVPALGYNYLNIVEQGNANSHTYNRAYIMGSVWC